MIQNNDRVYVPGVDALGTVIFANEFAVQVKLDSHEFPSTFSHEDVEETGLRVDQEGTVVQKNPSWDDD